MADIDHFMRSFKQHGTAEQRKQNQGPDATTLPFADRDQTNDQRQKIVQRNKEYNDFLETKGKEKRRHGDQTFEADDQTYATLPLKNQDMTKRDIAQQRNREYNDFIREKHSQQTGLERFIAAEPTDEGIEIPERTQKGQGDGLGGTLLVGDVDSREARRNRQQQYGAELKAQIQAKENAKNKSRMMELKVDPTGAVDPEKDPSRIRNIAPKVPVATYRPGHRNASSIFPMDDEPAPPPARYEEPFQPMPAHIPQGGSGGGGNVVVIQRQPQGPKISSGRPLDLSRLDAVHSEIPQHFDTRPPPQLYSGLAQEALNLLNRRPILPNAIEQRESQRISLNENAANSVAPLNLQEENPVFQLNGLLPANLFPPGYIPQGAPQYAPYASPDRGFQNFQSYGVGDGGGGGNFGGQPSGRNVGGQTERKWKNEETYSKDDKMIADEKERKKKEYELELKQQMEEQARKKAMEKQKFLQEDMKKLEEMKNYDPFGRGGGGAPFKDKRGNIVADLKRIRGGDEAELDFIPPPPPIEHPRYNEPTPRDGYFGPKPTTAISNESSETNYARGGHGIFGNPKSEDQKRNEDKYKRALERQMEEKKHQKEEEKRKIRAQEEKEIRQYEEQNKKVQDEMNRELLKNKFKEEEMRTRNEELIREANERKVAAHGLKLKNIDLSPRIIPDMDDDWARLKRELTQPLLPPPPGDTIVNTVELPAATNLIKLTHRLAVGTNDPLSGRDQIGLKSYSNSSSGEGAAVTQQLSHMRRILEDERRRVEEMLRNRENEAAVNPNILKKDVNVGPIKNVDIFEMARLRGAALARRTGSAADARNVDDFSQLKSKKTKSREGFRNIFPENPFTNTGLELQQLAMLRQQEEKLAAMKTRPLGADITIDRDRVSAARLQSDTAFLDLDGNLIDLAALEDAERKHREHLEHFDELPGSDRAYRSRRPPSGNSINPDRIMEENQERLRRLKEGGDDTSLADPDDILDSFMTKQVHNRPGSQRSLYDDTWLYPIGPQQAW